MAKKFHLALFTSASFGGDSAWMRTSQGYDIRYPEIYRDTARICERAKFDMIFFADGPTLPDAYQGGWDYYARKGMWMPVFDPVPALGLLSGVTDRLGLAVTLSTSFYPPFMAARALATIDHFSRGRVAWNVVTSLSKSAAQNFGQDDLLDHDLRYDVADEYINLCHQLWKSWEPDALVLDREHNIFADGSKIHAINFEGRYHKSRGPLTVPASPQGHPVIISAGASPRGMRFAAEQAEITVVGKSTVPAMKAFTDNLKARLAEAGRPPDACKVFNLFRPVIGETDAIAHERWQEQAKSIEIEQGLANFSYTLGCDLSLFDPDQPLPADMSINAIRSKFQSYYENGNPTLREIATQEARNAGFPIVGTPEHIADVLEEAAREGGIDGFMLRLTLHDQQYLVEFVDKVVPILQRRGLCRTEYAGTMLRDHLHEFDQG
jgi:FMN-dependent oxidoreductase (nitrilotriacetate monooxygenase family)